MRINKERRGELDHSSRRVQLALRLLVVVLIEEVRNLVGRSVDLLIVLATGGLLRALSDLVDDLVCLLRVNVLRRVAELLPELAEIYHHVAFRRGGYAMRLERVAGVEFMVYSGFTFSATLRGSDLQGQSLSALWNHLIVLGDAQVCGFLSLHR